MLDRLSENKKVALALGFIGTAASLIGVIVTVVSTVSIVITPSATNWIALATIAAMLLAWAGFRWYQHIVALGAYRYQVVDDLLTLTFSPDLTRQADGKVSPRLKVTSERTCRPLHNFAFEFLELSKFYRDPNADRLEQLGDSHTCYIKCPDRFGNDNPVKVVANIWIDALRPYKVWIPAPKRLEGGGDTLHVWRGI